MEVMIENLSKASANGVKALDNVSLIIPAGVRGLLSPNGVRPSGERRSPLHLAQTLLGA